MQGPHAPKQIPWQYLANLTQPIGNIDCHIFAVCLCTNGNVFACFGVSRVSVLYKHLL